MSRILIGEIKQINRYPIKSFSGESLNSTRIEAYGLYGDRSHALVDETKEGWDSYITAREIPQLLRYKVEFIGEGTLSDFPQVKITSPQGHTLYWDQCWIDELQSFYKNKISLIRHDPQNKENMAVDNESILLITESSLTKLESIWGGKLDPRRFRANFIISLNEGITYDDNELIGKHLTINNAEFHINEECKRCSMITMDPDNLERDASLLKTVSLEMNLNFGVYARVVKTGEVNLGDKIYITV